MTQAPMSEDPNALLLSLLAAEAHDESIVAAMTDTVFGLTGEVGPHGFGATTLEGHLALFTHPEFYHVAGLPEGLQAVEATARQAVDYAKAVGLLGFVLNPGTHQRFVPLILWQDAGTLPDAPRVPVLAPLREVPSMLAEAVVAAAESSPIEAVWIAEGPVLAARPHPEPAFLAGLLARDVRLPVYGASLWWSPVFAKEGTANVRATFAPLAEPVDPALAADLASDAGRSGLTELWAFTATFDGQPSGLALAYSPHPHDVFAADFDRLHQKHGLGQMTVPLLSADVLREALPRIGTRLF
jgi:hypothetical protein